MVNRKNFHSWRIGTINIRTGKDDIKLEHVIREIAKAKLSVCALQEVRRLNNNSVLIANKQNDVAQNYELYWSGHATKRQHGVGIAIKVEKGIDIEEVTPVSPRIITANLLLHGCSLRVICCYAPTEDDSESSKNLFYSKLNKQLKCENTRKIIVLGDFNASTSAAWYNSSLRENVIIDNLVVNNNGLRFHEFFNSYRLSVLNTWFTHKKSRRITWHSPDHVTKKVYDFILSCSWLRQYVSNCRVYNSYDFDSDHRLVIADIHTPSTKVGRNIKRKVVPKKKILNLKCLKQTEIQDRFISTTVTKLENIDLTTTNSEINDQLLSSINTSAEESIPKLDNTRLYQPWHNDNLLKELYELKDQQISQNANSNELSKTRKRIRLRSRFLRNQYFKSEAEKINQLAINRELEKLFSQAKKQETTLKTAPSKCAPEKLLNHFRQHFNPDHSEFVIPEELSTNIPDFVHELQEISEKFPINNSAPSIQEIQKHLHLLKTVKACNDVDPELIKRCEHPIMLQVINKITDNLWSNMDLPIAWGNSKLKTLWKGKGSKSDPSKYRGISIGSTVCKLVISIILERIRPWYEAQLSDEQNGFRKNRGTTDGIYSVKRVHQISNRKKQPLFLLFVDLTAAFDHIPRKWLFESIKLRFPKGENVKLFEILEKLYKHTSLTYQEAMITFLVSSGVRQGGPESPLLFNLFVDFVMRVFVDKCKSNDLIHFFQHKYRINTRSITREQRLQMRNDNKKLWGLSTFPWCGYADDLILFLLDQNSLQNASTLLDQVFTSFGLCINEKKTETMILNHACLETDYPDSIITLRDVPLQNSVEFKYLGSYISQDQPNTGDSEISHRIQMALAKFASMSNLLQNFHIHLTTRVIFLNSFVRSRLTYSCQNWNLTMAQFNKLDTTYRNLLRRMVRGGFRRVDGIADFRYKINNEKLHAICHTNDVSEFIRRQQRNYASHIIRMPIDRSLKQLMFNDDIYHRIGRVTPSLLDQVLHYQNLSIENFINISMK